MSHSVAWLFLRIHLGCIQTSPTLKLVRDYVRFVLAFFEVINTSAPHIYHSALLLIPRKSITHEMYKKHASPLARVVQGIPISWERVVATADFDDSLHHAVWSPCSRFIAVVKFKSVEVLDAVTLSRLFIFDGSSYAIIDQQLGFSPDGHCLTLHVDERLISWDLQTGGPLGTIHSGLENPYTELFSFKHSEDGKVVVVAYKSRDFSNGDEKRDTFIYTYDLLSGRRAGPRCVPEGQIIVHPIWTHDEYFRFATIDPRSIRIWQSPFTLEHPPVEVASLPIPDGTTDARRFLFLPALSRLAFVLGDTIQVLDLGASKRLLESELMLAPQILLIDNPCGSFSSDGRFFAYMNTGGEVYVWEESPAGYLLHQQLQFLTRSSLLGPQLSPNGDSIIVPLNREIHRWYTRDQVLSLPSVSTEDSGRHLFTLSFSPDGKLAAFARRQGNIVTIIELKSGERKLHIDTDVEIGCLGMTGGTVIVVGKDSIVTWNLPGGDCTFNASINDIVRTTVLNQSLPSRGLGMPQYMSTSPDLSRVVFVMETLRSFGYGLEVYDLPSGSRLARIKTHNLLRPQFTQDGREVWAAGGSYSGRGEQCEIIEDSESGAIELKLQRTHRRRSGVFRESSRGYSVTDGWWVLSPSQKRLLWLPHRWRSNEWNREWGNGRFLGLLHGELSEVVILEFLE